MLALKLVKRFYEALVLLLVLSQVQGERIPGTGHIHGRLESLDEIERRRQVLYHLCIMCDFQKGGYTVTAMSAEHLPSGPKYWVAANGQLPKIVRFLQQVLSMLEDRHGTRTWERKSSDSNLEERLFNFFVDFQRRRIKGYWKLLQDQVRREMQRVRLVISEQAESNEYYQWLCLFQAPLRDLSDTARLSRLAYDERHSRFMSSQFNPVTHQPQPESMASESHVLLRHYVGRLAAPKRAARILAYVADTDPNIFSGFSIAEANCGIALTRPSAYPGLTVEGISNRMFSNDEKKLQIFRRGLQELDRTGSIMKVVQEHYSDDNWLPRVHAELILLEKLHENRCTFYNDDKYIACSKPACFCCYHYICSHPGSFVPPPCHNKVYINWSPPQVPDSHGNHSRDIMNKLTHHIRRAVVDRVLKFQLRNQWHPDSTSGITPSLGADVVDQDLLVLTPPPRLDAANLPSNFEDPDELSALEEIGGEENSDQDNEEGGVALPNAHGDL